MQRKCENWLKTYMEYTHLLESPDNYHLWVGLSVVCMALRRNVWIDMAYFKVFPNLYVVLVSPPGKCRKNVAITAGVSLFDYGDFDLCISSESITREALIRALKNAERVTDGADGKVYVQSSLTIVSEELSVFLGQSNFPLMSLLTDLYDNPNKWEYRTKQSGVDTIVNVWVSMLGGSTPTWLSGSIPLSAIGGGFTSRIIFVVEDDVRKRTPFLKFTEHEFELREKLVHDLGCIAQMRGAFTLTEEAQEFYSKWYSLSQPTIVHDRVAGYFERKHIHVLKVASILSACRDDELVITKDDIELALAMLDAIEPKMIEAFGAVGRSELTPDVDLVLKIIMKMKVVRRKELLNMVWRDVDPRILDVIIQTLKNMGLITVQVEKDDMVYYFKETKK